MQVNVKITSHSVFPDERELISFDLFYPRMIHAQLLTHRWNSRNSRSSRAMSVEDAVVDVLTHPVEIYPVAQGRGMIPPEGVDGLDFTAAMARWKKGRDEAIRCAEDLAEAGVHAEVANRVLEPFMHIRTKVTATRRRLFGMVETRSKGDSQKPFDMLARQMVDKIVENKPVARLWHLPYADENTVLTADELLAQVAWAARVSYDRDYEKQSRTRNIKLAKRLAKDGHWSPFEHIACYSDPGDGVENNRLAGNFEGQTVQFRRLLEETARYPMSGQTDALADAVEEFLELVTL